MPGLCEDSLKIQIEVRNCLSTGIQDLVDLSKLIHIYPNPAINKFNLLNDNNLSDIVSLRMFNVNGQLIKEIHNTEQFRDIDTPNESGMYYVQILLDNNVSVNRKLVVLKN